jgi:hypothetical protein
MSNFRTSVTQQMVLYGQTLNNEAKVSLELFSDDY